MNTSLLKKCLDELSADHPRLDYMKGILETLIEMSSNTTSILSYPSIPVYTPPYVVTSSTMNLKEADKAIDEVIPDFLKPGPTGKMQDE